MASVIADGQGFRIMVMVPGQGRKTLRTGKMNKRTAEGVAGHLEAIVAARTAGEPLPRSTLGWIADGASGLKDKIARLGLIEGDKQSTLGAFLREHVLNRTDVKPATLEVWQQPCRNLIAFFGDEKSLRSITPGDAERFKAWLLTQDLAPATIAKRLSFARTFLHTARKHRFIEENPFAELKIPTVDVSARQWFINRDTLGKLLAVADPIWRTIISLARLGGLRCPSEVLSLEWRHVNFEAGTIEVISPKTSRYSGKASRTIPLFADLRQPLEEAFELAEPGAVHVVGGGHLAKANTPRGWANINLRGGLERLIHRAGLQPWERLFHNLRSSRETELLEEFPAHVVAAWMGHAVKVSMKHYAQVTPDHYAQATTGAKSVALLARQGDERNRTERNTSSQVPVLVGVSSDTCDVVPFSAEMYSGEGGIRRNEENAEKQALSPKGGAESGALAQILKLIDELTPGEVEALLATLAGRG